MRWWSVSRAGQSGALAWDLFAGVGLFARQLAASFTAWWPSNLRQPQRPLWPHNLNGTSANAVQAATLDFLRRAVKS